MNRLGMVGLDYASIGAMLANEDDDAQSALFGAFATELLKCCKSHYHAEMQMAMIDGKLKKIGKSQRELLSMLGRD